MAKVVRMHPKPATRWSLDWPGRRVRAECPCGWKGKYHRIEIDDDEAAEKAAEWAAKTDAKHHFKRKTRG